MQQIREVEERVLDQEFKKYSLLKRPRSIAITHILKIWGHIHRDLTDDSLSHYDERTLATGLKLWSQAADHCVRWAVANCPDSEEYKTAAENWEEIDQEAMDFLTWGYRYGQLFVDHVAWSRGLLTAEIDAAEKVISFNFPKQTLDPTVLMSQWSSESFCARAFIEEKPVAALKRLYQEWSAKISLTPPVEIPVIEFDHHGEEFLAVKKWTSHCIFPELGDDYDLNGYTLAEFRQFYAALFIVCQCVANLEDEVDLKEGRTNTLGSSTLQLKREEMVKYLSSISGVRSSATEEILGDLTFKVNSFRSSLSTQPFVEVGGSSVAALARLIPNIDPYRVLATGLLGSKRRKTYESIVETLERQNVEKIALRWSECGYTALKHRQFTAPDGEKLSPDLVICRKDENFVLIADYKHALPPLNPAQVDEKVQELSGWLEQVRNYKSIFSANPELIFGTPNGPKNAILFDCMLIFRWPMALPVEQPSDVAFADRRTLEHNLAKRPIPPLSLIADFYRKLRYRLPDGAQWITSHEEICVGDWIYRHPFLGSK